MKLQILLTIVIFASVSANIPPRGWTTTTKGWSTPPPSTQGWSTTTKGWNTPPPSTQGWTTTTKGWNTPPPSTQGWSTTTKGWNTPPPSTQGWSTPGWGPSINIAELAAQLAASGSGWAAENHADDVAVLGGWDAPAELLISSGGDSGVSQAGDISQVTQLSPHHAAALQLSGVNQLVASAEALGILSQGLDVIAAQSGSATSAGEGASGSDAQLHVQSTKK